MKPVKPVPDNLEELKEPGWKAWGRIFAAAIKAETEQKKEEEEKTA